MLQFFYSTMQGGKSTALLQQRYNLLAIGKKILVMTFALDDRYGIGKVTSRMGPQCDAQLFTEESVFDMDSPFTQADELFIDEAQFLSPESLRVFPPTPPDRPSTWLSLGP